MRYLVMFYKKVLGGNGHEVDACQYAMEIAANDRIVAEDRAKKCFCQAHRLTHWSVHADRIEVLEGQFPVNSNMPAQKPEQEIDLRQLDWVVHNARACDTAQDDLPLKQGFLPEMLEARRDSVARRE